MDMKRKIVTHRTVGLWWIIAGLLLAGQSAANAAGPPHAPAAVLQCPADDYEPNDNFDEARSIDVGVEHTAYICPSGDEDWFKFYAQPGQEITVDLYGLYGELPADFDLYLLDPWETPVAESASGGAAAEHIVHTAEQEGEYRVRLIGYMGAFSGMNPYRLQVTLSGEPPATPTPTGTPECPPDGDEPNESFDQARSIDVGVEHTAYICPSGDEDWSRFYVQPGQEITVDLYGLYGDLPADYDLYLLDPGEAEVASSASGGGAAEHIVHTAEQEGEYRVRIIGYMGAFSAMNPYRLQVMLGGAPTATATATPTVTRTATATQTPTATQTATATASATATRTATQTPTATPTPTATQTRTPEATATTTPVPGFVLRRAVFGAAGSEATSSTYRLRTTLGQGSPIGESRSTSYRLRGGFWHAAGEVKLPDLQAVTEVSPDQGGALTAPDGRVEITFPPSAVSQTVTVTYTQRSSPAEYTGSLLPAGNAFAFQAAEASGQPVTQFERPFTLTLHYTDDDWQRPGIPAEGNLNLYHWSAASSQWVMVPRISHDTVANVLVASLDHLTEFALLGSVTKEGYAAYLPVIMKQF